VKRGHPKELSLAKCARNLISSKTCGPNGSLPALQYFELAYLYEGDDADENDPCVDRSIECFVNRWSSGDGEELDITFREWAHPCVYAAG
jgi:hypothetical protein